MPFDRSHRRSGGRRPRHRRRADPGPDHRPAAGARPAPATRSSPPPAARPATCRRSGTPPTAASATSSSASPAWATRSRRPSGSAWPSPTRRAGSSSFLGDGTFLMAPDRAGHGRPGGAGGHRRGPREPRLPGHPPPADAPQRPRVRQRVPLPHGRPRPGRRRQAAQSPAGGRLPRGRPGPGGRRPRGAGAAGPATARRSATPSTTPATTRGPVVIVVPAIPHADLPGAGVWWDVAPAEVSETPGGGRAAGRVRAGPGHSSGGSDDGRRHRPGRGIAAGRRAAAGPAWPRGADRRDLPRDGLAGDGGGLRRRRARLGPARPGARRRRRGAGRRRSCWPPAAYGVPTVVRVETDARIRLGRVLDLGAAGVMLPRLDIGRARSPRPCGTCATRPAATAAWPPTTGPAASASTRARWTAPTSEVLCVVQIESAAAVAQADAIAAVDGVDVLFVGPRDLSHDLGVPGDVTAPDYLEALDDGPGRRRPATARPAACWPATAPPPADLRGQGWALRRRSAPTRPCSRPPLGTALAARPDRRHPGGDR